MQDRKPTTQKRLMQEFQQINADVAEEIDIKIKTKVLAYESSDFNRDISEEIQKEIKKHTKVKNLKLIKKKSNKLAKEYLENNRIWILQENWYCLLAYFITIATMILRCVEVDTKMNDIISFGIYFRLFRGNGGLKTATTPVFIHAKRHSVFDLEVECVYQSIQGTPYRAYFVCF